LHDFSLKNMFLKSYNTKGVQIIVRVSDEIVDVALCFLLSLMSYLFSYILYLTNIFG